MNLRSFAVSSTAGVVMMEMIIAVVSAMVVATALISGSVAIQRSITATDHFAVNVANETRLMDYVARDLRRAVRVGMLVGGTVTPLRDFERFTVSETRILTINLPDYYLSNTPNGAGGSPFRTSRYSRENLDSSSVYNPDSDDPRSKFNGIVPWEDAHLLINGNRSVSRFTPAASGSDEIQVRYYRGARSNNDPAVCFFRAEYPNGTDTPTQVVEIAERILDNRSETSLIVTGENGGETFRLESSFTPRYRRTNTTNAGTKAFVEVILRNPRRDSP